MKFFVDFKVPLNHRIGITNLLGNITTKPDSHKGGWARLLRCQLINEGYKDVRILTNNDQFSDFDTIIFDLGAEFGGGLNLFGGLDNKVFTRLKEILTFEGGFYSWQHKLPDVTSLEKRKSNKSTCEEFKKQTDEFITWIQDKLNTCNTFDHVVKKDHILIGDSHTPGVWTPDMMIERKDGRTLFGSLRDELLKQMVGEIKYSAITVHISSIDIRHHICRQDNPGMSLGNMVVGLANQLQALGIPAITICSTMGIEDQSRKLPKTGYYKGTPFHGQWAERHNMAELFNALADEICDNNDWFFLEYPQYFYDEEDKLKFEVMEKPQSVHISPSHYRWDLDKNKLRWKDDE